VFVAIRFRIQPTIPIVITESLLNILRCPQSRTRLSVAEPILVANLNRAISLGTLRNLAGERVERQLSGALVREAGDVAYPIIDDIPVLIPDEGIDLASIK
jgi:uncharacterized protein YbaR (Trm112 family)